MFNPCRRTAVILANQFHLPSDFGFHNAIYTDEGVKFIDFEFAGWDDPMKATIDFFLQPQLPVPERPYYCLDPYTRFEELRYKKMREVLQLKWVCIILSILNKQRLEEIAIGWVNTIC